MKGKAIKANLLRPQNILNIKILVKKTSYSIVAMKHGYGHGH